MRREVLQALETSAMDVNSPSSELFGKSGHLAPADYSNMLSKQQVLRLQHTQSVIEQLRECLSQLLAELIVDYNTSTSLNICNSDNSQSVVVDLSIYGPLVAVFTYGNVSASTIEMVSSCIARCKLIQLTPDEVQQLEAKGDYHKVF